MRSASGGAPSPTLSSTSRIAKRGVPELSHASQPAMTRPIQRSRRINLTASLRSEGPIVEIAGLAVIVELHGPLLDHALEMALGRMIVSREGLIGDGQADILPEAVMIEIGPEAGDARAHVAVEEVGAVAGEPAAAVLVVAVDLAVLVAFLGRENRERDGAAYLFLHASSVWAYAGVCGAEQAPRAL